MSDASIVASQTWVLGPHWRANGAIFSRSGTIAGDSTDLTGNGSTSQSGMLTIEDGGQTIQRPIDSHTSFVFSMTVTGASCEAAKGVLSGAFTTGTFAAINGSSFDEKLERSKAQAFCDAAFE
jgi:hypothetical protein